MSDPREQLARDIRASLGQFNADEPVVTLVARLADELAGCREALRRIRRMAELSAAIMRDPERTGGWSGAERVARGYERIAERAALKER